MLLGNFTVVQTVMRPNARLIGVSLATEIGTIHDAYLLLPVEEQLPWLQRLDVASKGSLVLEPGGPVALNEPDNEYQADSLSALREQLPGMAVGFAQGEPPQVWFALPAPGGDARWLRIPVVNVPDRSPILFAIWGSGGILVILAGLVVIGWRQHRHLRSAGTALERLEWRPSTPPVQVVALSAPNAAPPADLPLVRSLEELVGAMSARMQRMVTQRDDALASVARQVRAALQAAPAQSRGASSLQAFDRIASQFDALAGLERLQSEPLQMVDLDALVERATSRAPVGVSLGLAPVPPLPLRPRAMECLVDNLLSNALVHGGGHVVLTCVEEGGCVVLTVLDRGEPLADDELAMLGLAFYRTDAARAKGPAAGVGLAIARRIAQMHGGELRIQRRDGGGLSVQVRLPLPREEASAPSVARRALWLQAMPAWVGVLADSALLAALYIVTLVVSVALLTWHVMLPNQEMSGRIFIHVMRGISASYTTLPADTRRAYLRDLAVHSGGLLHSGDPSRHVLRAPVLPAFRTALDMARRELPELELETTRFPASALWVRLPPAPGEPAGPWLVMHLRPFSADLLVFLLGLVLVTAASAIFVALRARRRLAWAAQALAGGETDLPARALARGESPALAAGLMAVRQQFVQACEGLAQAKDEQEVLLARLVRDLREAIDALRMPGTHSAGWLACADLLHGAIEGLDALARREEGVARGRTDLNAVLRALPADPAAAQRHPLAWVQAEGVVPLAGIDQVDARRLLGAILDFLLAQPQGRLEVSCTQANGWVIVRFTQQSGRTDPGAAAQALVKPCQLAESLGGFMRFSQAPDQAGVQVEILLPAARAQ